MFLESTNGTYAVVVDKAHPGALSKLEAGRTDLRARLNTLGLERVFIELVSLGIDFFEDLCDDSLMSNIELQEVCYTFISSPPLVRLTGN
jgi:hypothetical protein